MVSSKCDGTFFFSVHCIASGFNDTMSSVLKGDGKPSFTYALYLYRLGLVWTYMEVKKNPRVRQYMCY